GRPFAQHAGLRRLPVAGLPRGPPLLPRRLGDGLRRMNGDAANPLLASVLARLRRAAGSADAVEQKLELRLERWPKRVVVSALSVAGDPSRPNEDAYAVVP